MHSHLQNIIALRLSRDFLAIIQYYMHVFLVGGDKATFVLFGKARPSPNHTAHKTRLVFNEILLHQHCSNYRTALN